MNDKRRRLKRLERATNTDEDQKVVFRVYWHDDNPPPKSTLGTRVIHLTWGDEDRMMETELNN